jgi:hypothetical protein
MVIVAGFSSPSRSPSQPEKIQFLPACSQLHHRAFGIVGGLGLHHLLFHLSFTNDVIVSGYSTPAKDRRYFNFISMVS